MFLRPFGEHSISKDEIECNSYNAVFVEKEHKANINQLIVKNELAEFDPETIHFTNIFVDWNSLALTDSDEEDWDSDIGNNIFDAGSYLNKPNEKSLLSFLGSNESNEELDIDINFGEEDINEWVSNYC